MPAHIDPEKMPMTANLLKGPRYVTLVGTTFKISPISFDDVDIIYNVTFSICDSGGII